MAASDLIAALGGLGLFLFGMIIMTGALNSLADERLRGWLANSVNSPLKGAITGALSTAILQSSSATTVAVVGFVGAGLLTFAESLGVILGANIGTTITGWLVALVGFKLQLGQMMLPLILLGVLLRLAGRPKLQALGMALGGFGLIFVGIEMLQNGLGGMRGFLTPESFPPDTVAGRILLVLIGLLITLVTQSSSAGVATALVAVNTGAISLNQAAAMVIGMDVGTTATAALATIGGNVNAKRTGFAHVFYNTFSGTLAFALLTPYMHAIDWLIPNARVDDSELVLVGFHTSFNLLGVALILPFTNYFAGFIKWMIPEQRNDLTNQLDSSLLMTPPLAIGAAQRTLQGVLNVLLRQLRTRLIAPEASISQKEMQRVTDAIETTSDYLQEISAQAGESFLLRTNKVSTIPDDYVACIHVLDHVRRIQSRVLEEKRFQLARQDSTLQNMSDQLVAIIDSLRDTPVPFDHGLVENIHVQNGELKQAMKAYRNAVITKIEDRSLSTSQAIRRMDTARTIRRNAYHLWRIVYHLREPDAVIEQAEATQL